MRRKVYCDECRRLATAMRDFMIEIVEDLKARKAAREQRPEALPDAGSEG
jgi:hypothetical protein